MDFIQSMERETGKPRPRVDFIQRETAISPGMDETAPPDWTKSNEDDALREKTGFDWTKSNQASPNPVSTRVIPLPRSTPLKEARFLKTVFSRTKSDVFPIV
ncbi:MULTISPECIES: hypothetical protein [Cohnella]|uniref:hypothetical protein n=1 Tax=Cohnella TaxID=329857 RepID=UPI00111AB8BD|nr:MULTISPECIES: hypothetical protein [Cohnella]MBN2983086.1 hypothetical protein [Cohnella algarum]